MVIVTLPVNQISISTNLFFNNTFTFKKRVKQNVGFL